jgi:hypothetical protein
MYDENPNFVGGGGDGSGSMNLSGGNYYTHLNRGPMKEEGNVTEHTLPPYVALAYIMKL